MKAKEQRLRIHFLSWLLALLLTGFSLGVWAQEDGSSQGDPLESLESRGIPSLDKILKPDELAEFQEAVANGDQEKIQKFTKLVSERMTGKGMAMDKMVSMSLKTFRAMPRSDLKAHVTDKASGTLIGKLFDQFPSTIDLTVNTLQDPFALPTIFKIPQNRDKLYLFLGVNVFLWVTKWFFRRKRKVAKLEAQQSSAKSLGKRKLKKKDPFVLGTLEFFLFFFTIRICVFVLFFHREFYPLFLVVKRTYFS